MELMKCVFVGPAWFSLLQAVEATNNFDKDNKERSEQMISEDANLTFWTGVFDLNCKRRDRQFPYKGTGKKRSPTRITPHVHTRMSLKCLP